MSYERLIMTLKNNFNILNLIAEGFRFIISGLANTFITIAVYQIALFFLSAQLAYTISWVVGIAFVVIVYPNYVFQKKSIVAFKKLGIVSLYILNFLISSLLLNFLISFFGISSRVSIFIVLGCSTTINFLGMKCILNTKYT